MNQLFKTRAKETTAQQPPKPKVWYIDTNHTNIGFGVKHLALAKIIGHFSEYEGGMTLPSGDNMEGAEIYLKILAESIDTGNSMRDSHLKTTDFLDVKTFQDITFASTSFEPTGNNMYKLSGNLTLKGVTKPILLNAEYKGKTKDMLNNDVVIFCLNGSIDRTDFGVSWFQLLKGGTPVISKEISFDMTIELTPEA